jgi:hypothetical protein
VHTAESLLATDCAIPAIPEHFRSSVR